MNKNEVMLKVFLEKFLIEHGKEINDYLEEKTKDLLTHVSVVLVDSVGLKKHIDDLYALDNCVNNIRFADISIQEDIELYELLKSKGCCGFYDDQVYINGKTYLIGCNYGH